MAKIRIVIADSDDLYLRCLKDYMMEHMDKFEVYSSSTKEGLSKLVEEKCKQIDIIAFTEDMEGEKLRNSDIPLKIILSDGTNVRTEGYEVVNKYQKGTDFVNQLLLQYAKATGNIDAITVGNKSTKIIGFFSPIGGTGKTTLAICMCFALAQLGKRVFYLNAEKINSSAILFNKAQMGSMSDVYLSMKTKEINAGNTNSTRLCIMANKYTDSNTNITYVNPAESSLEINEITVDEYEKLLVGLVQLEEFDFIIVDFDSEISNERMQILARCDKLVVPFTAEELSLAKLKMFLGEIDKYPQLEEIENKFLYVLNKSNLESNSIMDRMGIGEKIRIRANIPLSPLIKDLNNLSHAKENIGKIMNSLVPML